MGYERMQEMADPGGTATAVTREWATNPGIRLCLLPGYAGCGYYQRILFLWPR